MLTLEILNSIEKSVLCWLATANKEGFPNVSPKEMFIASGKHHLVIANIASPQTAKNIKANPKVCVSFIDILVQKGFQLKGSAVIITKKEEQFATLAAPLVQMTEGKFPFHELFYIEVEKVKPITAPSYWMYPETTEAEKVASAKKSYGI
ncbi:MAG: pyridoxamine 5'-phosphate oxidase family protein [Bacteroidota bacterium]